MKQLKLILILALLIAVYAPVNAQQPHPGLKFVMKLIINDYIDVTNALYNNKVALAQNKAGKLVFDLNSVPDRDMSIQQHSAWFNYLGRMQNTSRQMGETDNIEEQRKQFAALSNAMYGMLKDTKLSPIIVYHQYSPSRDAYWLSIAPAIRNPYYGIAQKQMGKEGATRDILTPVK